MLLGVKKDLEDERKINYEIKTKDGEILKFTSDDEVGYKIIKRIAEMWIEEIRLDEETNEWYSKLYEGR